MVADHSAFEYEGEYDIEKDIPPEKEQYPNPDCRTPKYRTIFDVVRTGTLEAVEFLVGRYGLGILTERDDLGHTPAHWACIGGHADILEYMVEHGVPVDSPSLSKVAALPIHWACVHGHISVVDILIQQTFHKIRQREKHYLQIQDGSSEDSPEQREEHQPSVNQLSNPPFDYPKTPASERTEDKKRHHDRTLKKV
ncbi:ankyrin repeat domain-containing protein 23-like [Limulus polyphemus]|uniref:Ankyrin repeat domain-containing protein 23-like n=1 Tax=Limulus polyphemus TaxID=6850 RepID=A0ABM1TRZ2_LIMPO|nr:ankyrin repeat domain-containing protein 23-like [Limulus polyphemus]